MADSPSPSTAGKAIELPEGTTGTIRGTDGNNLITANKPANASITTGKGDDVININGGQNVSVEPGSGRNTVNLSGTGGTASSMDGKIYDETFSQKSSAIAIEARGGETTVNLDSGVRNSAVFGDNSTKINYSSPNRGEALSVKPDNNGFTLGLNGEKVITAMGDDKGEPSLTLNGKAVNLNAIRECMASTVSGGKECTGSEVMFAAPVAAAGVSASPAVPGGRTK